MAPVGILSPGAEKVGEKWDTDRTAFESILFAVSPFPSIFKLSAGAGESAPGGSIGGRVGAPGDGSDSTGTA
jgi:hypothetical protein